ncbi:hypothetical protein [Spirosoma flavum]|uniref:Uncharacterized protein n=1 Tax=Spirosoma flavum TaxID=2048557 RepID=A0ABW6ANI3_9BACT
MAILKIITLINWILISIYGLGVLYILPQQGSGTGHEMAGVGSILKGVTLSLLLLFVWMNWLPYLWTKITALIFLVLLFLIIYYYLKDTF